VTDLIRIVKKIFTDEKIDMLIGYERGTLPLQSTPCFIESPDDLNRLIFDFTCQNNLANYLINEKKHKLKRKIGIIAKGCDARSIIHLITEKQIDRDNLVIIGIPCSGVIDPFKFRKSLNGNEITDYNIDEDKIEFTGDEFKLKLDLKEILSDNCLSCQYPNAPEYDHFIGNPAEPAAKNTEFSKLEEFDKKTPDERWEYFQKEFSKCIRCYACRNACPMCYCEECFVDKNNPCWIGKGNDISDTTIFHIVRVMHTAGRCSSCGACSRACPLGVDITTLNSRITKEVKERFNFTPGLEYEKKSALVDYKEDDLEEFIM
jgi:formate dehydrogenase (coenzyme F420) beta subunit